jgi:hypothetical protein
MPEAAISGRQADAQVSGEPSAYKVKRMGELSAFPPTGSSAPRGVNASPKKSDSASARHSDPGMLGIERDNLYSMPCRMMPSRICAMHEWFAMREWSALPERQLKSSPLDTVSSLLFVR